MSLGQLPERPAFQTSDPNLESLPAPPFSRLAMVALLAGLVSLTTVFSIKLLPLAILVIALCVVAIWFVSRDPSVRGAWLAQVGLACAMLSVSWVVAANQLQDRYLYRQGADFAHLYLNMISKSETHEAYELNLPEAVRQITGTNLEAHYSMLPDGEERGRFEDFITQSTIIELANEPNADWVFQRGDGVGILSSVTKTVRVAMLNANKPNSRPVIVQLHRNSGTVTEGRPLAMWHVESTQYAKP